MSGAGSSFAQAVVGKSPTLILLSPLKSVRAGKAIEGLKLRLMVVALVILGASGDISIHPCAVILLALNTNYSTIHHI